MLRVLYGSGLEAKLKPDVYATYMAELATRQEQFKRSARDFQICKSLTSGSNISLKQIPVINIQNDNPHIVYDYRECRFLRANESPGDYKTMQDGGNIPCSLLTVLNFFKIHPTLFELGELLVENGYRTKNSGTLWLAIEKVPELAYGIQTSMQNNVWNMIHAVSMKQPVLAIVPRKWVNHSPDFSNNECIIIWRIENNRICFSSATNSRSMQYRPLREVLHNIKICWSFQRPL